MLSSWSFEPINGKHRHSNLRVAVVLETQDFLGRVLKTPRRCFRHWRMGYGWHCSEDDNSMRWMLIFIVLPWCCPFTLFAADEAKPDTATVSVSGQERGRNEERTVYKNSDWGYELRYPSDYVAVDRTNLDETRSSVPEPYRIVVDANREALNVEGSVFLFSARHMLSFSGEPYAKYNNLKKYLDWQLSLMPNGGKGELHFDGVGNAKGLDATVEVQHHTVAVQTGEAHEFISTTYSDNTKKKTYVYTILLPVKDKFLEAGFSYSEDNQDIVPKMKEILLSIKEGG